MAGSTYDFARGTFHSFVVFGRRPGSVLWLALWQVLAYVAMAALVLTALWPMLSIIISAAEAGREPTDAEVLAVLGSIWIVVALSYLGAILVLVMVQGAWLRLLTHGRTAPIIPLRFGADELRLLGVNLLFVVFALVGYLVAALVTGLVTALVIGAGVLAFNFEAGAAALGGGLMVLLVIAFSLLAIVVMLRFAAAPAMTVNEGRFRLFESFAATRDIWGWMLLSYVVLYALIFVAASVISGVQVGAVLIMAADLIAVMESMDASPDWDAILQLLLRPSVIFALAITVGLQLVLQVVIEGSWHGVGAYAALRHAQDAGEAETITAPPASVGDAPREG